MKASRSPIAIINRYRPAFFFRVRQAVLGSRMGLQLLSLMHRAWFALRGYPEPGRYPDEIAIETVSRCNADCGFCPVAVSRDPRPLAYMPDELLEKIASELGSAGYGGIINLFLNNEPLIDRRIAAICAMFHAAVPGASLCLFTNGKTLDKELFFALFDAGLDLLCINHYSTGLQLGEATQRFLDALASSEHPRRKDYFRRAFVRLRLDDEVLNNRVGRAPNKTLSQDFIHFRRNGCFRPFEQMAIRVTGEVSKCCNDTLGEATLGDVRAQTLAEIWQGQAYREVRSNLQTQGRGSEFLCERCDADVSLLTNRDRHRIAHGLLDIRAWMR